MPYSPNQKSKANQFCVETAKAIRHYLAHRRDPGLRGTFTARDLADAGILIPKTSFRMLRTRGWIERLESTSSSACGIWRLSGDARVWLDTHHPLGGGAV